MNEVTIIRTPQIVAAEINSIKQQTMTMILCNSIEIGRRLHEAKALLEHGEWGEWLKLSVDYSQRTASNLMRIFDEYGANQTALFGDNAKSQALANLSYTQAVALLGISEEEREEFVRENDISNMSTRELQEAIKAQKKAEKRAADAEKKATKADKTADDALQEVARLVALLGQAKNNGSSDEKLKLLETELQNAQNQVQDLTNKINEPITIEPVVIEKIPEEIELELAELRGKLEAINSQPVSNPAILKYSIHFEALVNGFKNLLGALAEIAETDTEAHEKYKHAISGLLGKMSERL